MSFREWIETNAETPPATSAQGEAQCESKAETAERRMTLEEMAWDILTKTRDEILQGGRWQSSPETRAADAEINELYQAVTAGGATLEAFAGACAKWKRVGTEERTQRGPA